MNIVVTVLQTDGCQRWDGIPQTTPNSNTVVLIILNHLAINTREIETKMIDLLYLYSMIEEFTCSDSDASIRHHSVV
jgi:hypothetical protein